MTPAVSRALVWFRRDLRIEDHAALHHALRAAAGVFCVFVFDRGILAPLPRADRRVDFIRASLVELDAALESRGGGLIVLNGDPLEEVPRLARELGVQAVYANHDDEPYSRARDDAVRAVLAEERIDWRTRKDHVVFERDEVLTASGTPFSVFTPYKNAWLKKLTPEALAAQSTATPSGRLLWPARPRGVPNLADIGFLPTNVREFVTPGMQGGERLLEDFLARIDGYADARDFPAVHGPSYLSAHVRFGTVSIRALARAGYARMQAGSRGAEVWLGELIWRDFYHQVLHHHPHVVERSFRREYDAVQWESGERAQERFAAWREARTGYPLVDAAMLQLERTGYMHNRLRMVVASFLTKDLGVDWRWGERHFAERLLDFDLAANNGGWQWAASTGCDAQPYFRIFNPVSQSRRFDANGVFIRRYLPQLERLSVGAIHAPWLAAPAEIAAAGIELGVHYPYPIVDHARARERTLERYGIVKTLR